MEDLFRSEHGPADRRAACPLPLEVTAQTAAIDRGDRRSGGAHSVTFGCGFRFGVRLLGLRRRDVAVTDLAGVDARPAESAGSLSFVWSLQCSIAIAG